ncbi:MAG: hypothetical protein HOB84_09000 [Candidatus Marinimicrobia bacterium]|nr:hypothetical protein [Candidatus Neomarinimicrobiota bacterium]MBT4360726.1 hypothetical protein [Candidatus Neomarinimicrobiota bacterium]MBT4714898.1 hypothetical protein [Candidatus Neomarinimicrobiota bacterium]MBT4945403.1 hypothetical protein [Candidatus Neomarinimicrobiota bacterium]MBT5269998.1 hypothetical protein [Candidatus Neomarinimicrobiota bacterium]
MTDTTHNFHIPVMGTGHSIDTPIRLAHLGITSVISIIDDILLERLRKYYTDKYDLPFERITHHEEDGRAKRITAYLDMVQDIVEMKMENVRALPFFEKNEKSRYFELLPDTSSLKKSYHDLMDTKPGELRDKFAKELSRRMKPGSIDVNIMVKVDRIDLDKHGKPLGEGFSDGKAALRGYAKSKLDSAMVFSAGINQSLYGYMTKYQDFYRDQQGEIKKKIVLKVSDFRSAMIQGRYMAKKGLEISEFRIESGLNCGGHAFASPGHLLPILLQDFKDKRAELGTQFQPIIKRFYDKMEWEYPENLEHHPEITVQGGIGNHGEVQRLEKDFGMDRTGWASPFLLVPEATPIDTMTRLQLMNSTDDSLYLSGASPLGVPFNNLKDSGSEKWSKKRYEQGKPGSACPKGFLVSNTEFTELPICTASSEYMTPKLAEIEADFVPGPEKDEAINRVLAKACLCEHLGNGALISLGIVPAKRSPQAICPGPNLSWFNRNYSLEEMVDQIYGRGKELLSSDRPHMFAKEIQLYVDHFRSRIQETMGPKEYPSLHAFYDNMIKGFEYCKTISTGHSYPGENLPSLSEAIEKQGRRLEEIYNAFKSKISTEVSA